MEKKEPDAMLVTPCTRTDSKPLRANGFTLVEMLVVAPLVLLLVGVIIGFITTITGDALATNNRGSITYSAQQALDITERDIRLAGNFLKSSGSLPAEQTPPGGASTFTSTDSLILQQNATSSNPYSSYRNLVYFKNQPESCGGDINKNETLKVKLVYFLDGNKLYKRTIIPEYSTSGNNVDTVCSTPWQRNSCAEGDISSTNICGLRDELVATNVASFSIEYFKDSTSTVPLLPTDATNASSIRITIETDDKVAGRFADFKGSVRASKINPSSEPLTVPSTPYISRGIAGTTSVKFNWKVPDNTTFYDMSYGINRSCDTTAQTNSRDSSYTVTANYGDRVYFCLVAKNIVGQSSTAYSNLQIPLWSTASMKNGWVDYSSSFEPFGFTKTADDEVFVKGLIKNPPASNPVSSGSALIATLPPGYRPSNRLFFPAPNYYANGRTNSQTMITVETNGDIKTQAGHADTRWLSLAHVRFMSSTASGCSWRNLSISSAWSNYGGAYSDARVCIDGSNRAHTEGLVRTDPVGRNADPRERMAAASSSGWQPGQGLLLIFPATDYQEYASFDLSSYSTSGVQMRNRVQKAGGYTSTQAEYYTSNYSGMRTLSRRNNWVNYGGSFAPAQYTKSENVVTVQGLIHNGTSSNGTQVARLPIGYRPKKTIIYSLDSAGSQARVDVDSDGWITIVNGVSSSGLSLSGISFVAE